MHIHGIHAPQGDYKCWATQARYWEGPARAPNRRQTSTLRDTPNARHMADTPALAASAQFSSRTPVPSRQRTTCVASVRHSSRGKCTLHWAHTRLSDRQAHTCAQQAAQHAQRVCVRLQPRELSGNFANPHVAMANYAVACAQSPQKNNTALELP